MLLHHCLATIVSLSLRPRGMPSISICVHGTSTDHVGSCGTVMLLVFCRLCQHSQRMLLVRILVVHRGSMMPDKLCTHGHMGNWSVHRPTLVRIIEIKYSRWRLGD